MSRNKKGNAGDATGSGSNNERGSKAETFGDAMGKVGFEPLKTGRKLVGQGKPRETLKKWSPRAPGK